jgi:hypothetical protein
MRFGAAKTVAGNYRPYRKDFQLRTIREVSTPRRSMELLRRGLQFPPPLVR